MNTAIIEGSDILKLIPQRPPIVMVDEFCGMDDKASYTALTVKSDNIFCTNGYLREPGIIEHMAQSAAARVGYIFTQKNQPVPLGYIGSVDKLSIHQLPKTGCRIQTQISILQELGGLTLISAQTTTGDTPIAECRMKIFLDIANEN